MPKPSYHKPYVLSTKANESFFYKFQEEVLHGGEINNVKSTRWRLKGVDLIHWRGTSDKSLSGTIKPKELFKLWQNFYQYLGSFVTVKHSSEKGKSRKSRFLVHDAKFHKKDNSLSFMVDSGFDFPWKGSYAKIENIRLRDPIVNFSSTRWQPKGWWDPDNLENSEVENFAGMVIKDYRKMNFKDADLSWADFTGADLRKANLQNANLWNTNFIGADLRGAKFNGAYWFRTTCRDGTENTISSGTTLEDYEVIDRLSPCTKKQMSNDPIWYDNPDYFDELENNSGPER